MPPFMSNPAGDLIVESWTWGRREAAVVVWLPLIQVLFASSWGRSQTAQQIVVEDYWAACIFDVALSLLKSNLCGPISQKETVWFVHRIEIY